MQSRAAPARLRRGGVPARPSRWSCRRRGTGIRAANRGLARSAVGRTRTATQSCAGPHRRERPAAGNAVRAPRVRHPRAPARSRTRAPRNPRAGSLRSRPGAAALRAWISFAARRWIFSASASLARPLSTSAFRRTSNSRVRSRSTSTCRSTSDTVEPSPRTCGRCSWASKLVWRSKKSACPARNAATAASSSRAGLPAVGFGSSFGCGLVISRCVLRRRLLWGR